MNEELSSHFHNGDGVPAALFITQVARVVPDIITVVELPSRKILYSNNENLTLNGFSPEELLKMSSDERKQLVHPDDAGLVNKFYESFTGAAKDDGIHEARYRAKNKKGDMLTFFVRGKVFQRNPDGTVLSILNIVQNVTEKEKAEQNFKESKDVLRGISDIIPDVISIQEYPSRQMIYSNRNPISILGYNIDNSDGLFMEDPDKLVHPDDTPALHEHWNNFLNLPDGETTECEYRMRSATGEWLWLHARGKVFERDENDKPVKVLNVLQDITGRKKAEQQINENAHFIGQVMDTTPDIISIMDINTRQLIYCNRQIAADLGYTKTQIAAMENPLFDIMHKEDVSLVTDHLKKIKTVMQDDKVLEVEYRLINVKGDINWFRDRNAVFKRNNRKVPVEKIGITQNITEEKSREEQIITNLDIIAQAEEIVEMGSWEYDIVAGSFRWSEGMYHLFNLPKNKKVTPDIYFDYTLEEEHHLVSRIVDNIRYEFAPFEEIITLIPEGQEKKIVKIKAVVIKDRKKRPVKIIGVDLNITHQIKTAGEIESLNKILLTKNRDLEALNAELKTFNTVASRDYKETIQILYTNLEYIVSKEARSLSDTSKANIRRAQSAIQRMKLLTEDINAYLRLYDIGGNKSLINPNQIVANVISQLKGKIEQGGATIELTDLPSLYADPLLFSILITNLLDNSLKFRKLAFPAVIKIKYSQADEMNAIPAAIGNMPYTIISISDNGVGFREEDAENIFELFVRLQEKGKYKGSGIGLAMCKKIMAMHNGFITAESVPATGSTFNCYFPSREASL